MKKKGILPFSNFWKYAGKREFTYFMKKAEKGYKNGFSKNPFS